MWSVQPGSLRSSRANKIDEAASLRQTEKGVSAALTRRVRRDALVTYQLQGKRRPGMRSILRSYHVSDEGGDATIVGHHFAIALVSACMTEQSS